MDESEQNVTRYLLGELSEAERDALEEKYFADPQVFDQVLKAESELLDNYVRGRLSKNAREQFERAYLTDPVRRERVKFAEALATRIDQTEASQTVAVHKADHVSLLQRWQSLLVTLRGRRLALSVSIALVVLIAIGGLWSFIESRRLRRELAETQAAQAEQERRAREMEEQRAALERQQAEKLTAELNRQRNTQVPPAQPSPTPTTRAAAPAQTFVTLHLSIGVTRSADTSPAQTLVIPPGTKEVRLRLDLKENDYASYGVSLRAVGGREIFSRSGLKPIPAKSGARLNLTLPADGLITGDYMLTLQRHHTGWLG